jgi:putative transposase
MTPPYRGSYVGSLRFFISEFLEEPAEKLGVVERDGKLQIPVLVCAFVFGFATGESRTLAGFGRSYNLTRVL